MICILGAGVIGVTTAYYLARAGASVTVIDRQPGVALETSFANAGEISPGYASPWASPDVPLKALRWLLMRNGPLSISPRLDRKMCRWILQFLSNCNARSFEVNKRRMLRLSEYSRSCMTSLREETKIEFDARQLGTLQLFRKKSQLKSVAKDIAVLRDFGVEFELLDRDRCLSVEPALKSVSGLVAGGLRLPLDETGDCFLFTRAIAKLAEEIGVKFLFDTKVEKIISSGAKVSALRTTHGDVKADSYVVALGSYSPLLLSQVGLNLPVYPVKGYSLTFPVQSDDHAPRSTIMDESYKVAITRLGERIRVGGTAELSGYQIEPSRSPRSPLERSVGELFPQAFEGATKQYWSGLRPMTPDGPPVLGATLVSNLFLNTGHGTLGWTMACGSARVLADVLLGKKPDIEVADFEIGRFAEAESSVSAHALL